MAGGLFVDVVQNNLSQYIVRVCVHGSTYVTT